MQAPTIAMIIAHTKYRIGTCTEYKHDHDQRKKASKTLLTVGLELRTFRSTFFVTSNSSVLRSLPADPAPWYNA